MIRPQRFTILMALVLLLYLGAAAATGCHQDNCYRALSNRPSAATSFCRTFTTAPNQPIPTANPPPFTSQCANSPSRISSACSCIVPSSTSGVCEPTPAMDGARNGHFDQIAIPNPGDAIENMPPWYFDRMQGARGDFVRQPPNTGGEQYTGYGAAVWHIEDSVYPSTQNGGYLNAPLSVCNGRTYHISFWAKTESANPDPLNPGCFATVSTLLEGEIQSFRITGSSWRLYELTPVYTPIVDPIVNGVGREGSVYRERGEDWEGRGWRGWGWNDTLNIYMRCETSPEPITIWVDAVNIV